MKQLTRRQIALLTILFIIITGFIFPSEKRVPVRGASHTDWHHDTFWYEPWGKSGVHKGVDIFAAKGTDILSPSAGLVVFTGEVQMGGKVVLVLSGKWRLHYFAHLESIETNLGFISTNEVIGTVGDSGNAASKQPHLHYSIVSIIPYPWRMDTSTQGWKKMFFLNPLDYFN